MSVKFHFIQALTNFSPLALFMCQTAMMQKVKAGLGLQSKPAVELKADIKKWMFNDKTPLLMLDDQTRFSTVMSAFHNYEKMVGVT